MLHRLCTRLRGVREVDAAEEQDEDKGVEVGVV